MKIWDFLHIFRCRWPSLVPAPSAAAFKPSSPLVIFWPQPLLQLHSSQAALWLYFGPAPSAAAFKPSSPLVIFRPSPFCSCIQAKQPSGYILAQLLLQLHSSQAAHWLYFGPAPSAAAFKPSSPLVIFWPQPLLQLHSSQAAHWLYFGPSPYCSCIQAKQPSGYISTPVLFPRYGARTIVFVILFSCCTPHALIADIIQNDSLFPERKRTDFLISSRSDFTTIDSFWKMN